MCDLYAPYVPYLNQIPFIREQIGVLSSRIDPFNLFLCASVLKLGRVVAQGSLCGISSHFGRVGSTRFFCVDSVLDNASHQGTFVLVAL